MLLRNNACLSATTAVMEARNREINTADFITRYNSHAGISDDTVLISGFLYTLLETCPSNSV